MKLANEPPLCSNITPARRILRWACYGLCALTVSLCMVSPAAAQDDPAHQQFLFAYKLLQRGDETLAAEAFEEYLEKYPDAPKRGDAMYYRALLFRKTDHHAKAIELLAVLPKLKIVPRYAADLLFGQILNDQGEYAEALIVLEQISTQSLKPQSQASVLYLRGLTYRAANNLPAAARELAAAAKIQSTLKAVALLNLARVHSLLGKHEEAMVTLEACLALPDTAHSDQAARLGGDLAYQQQQYTRAIKFYERVVSAHQSSQHFGPAVVGILWSHYSQKQYHPVIESFQLYTAILPSQDRVTAGYLAGSAYQQLDHHDSAVKRFREISKNQDAHPLQEKIFYKLAASYYELNDDDAMQQAIELLLRQYPDSPLHVDAAYLLAASDARRGDFARGAARLTQIINKGPSHSYYAQALLHRAHLYERHEQYEAAVKDYRTYLNSAKVGISDASLRLIHLTYRLGRYDQTVAMADALLARDDVSELVIQEAMYRSALAKIKRNEPAAALAQLETLRKNHPLNAFNLEASYYRGVLLVSLQRGGEAEAILLEVADQQGLTLPQQSNALRLAAMCQREAGHREKVMATLEKLQQRVGRTALTSDELIWIARWKLAQGDAAGALAFVKPVTQKQIKTSDQAVAEAFYLTGQAQRQLQAFDAAVISFKSALAIGSDFDARSKLELGRTLLDQRHYELALAQLASLLDHKTSAIAAESLFDTATLHRAIARDRLRRGDTAGADRANHEAHRFLNRLVLLYPFEELEPLPQLAFLELSEIAVESNDSDAVERLRQELIEKYPKGPYAVYTLAVIKTDRRQLGDALAILETLEKVPSLDDRLRLRVETLRQFLEAQR